MHFNVILRCTHRFPQLTLNFKFGETSIFYMHLSTAVLTLTVVIKVYKWNSFKSSAVDFEMLAYSTSRSYIDFRTCARLPDAHLTGLATHKLFHLEGSGISERSGFNLTRTSVVSETPNRRVIIKFE
jgi:hypothetical protein